MYIMVSHTTPTCIWAYALESFSGLDINTEEDKQDIEKLKHGQA